MAPLSIIRTAYHFDDKLARMRRAPYAGRTQQSPGANWWLWHWFRLWRGQRKI